MGTRSIIGLKTGLGWFGRYCHWDGYPEGVGAGLWHIVKRDGVAEAVKTLITNNYSWSCLTADMEPDRDRSAGYKFVAGYGYAHRDGKPDDIITDKGDKWGTEYAYIISREGLTVMSVDYEGTTQELGFYRWDMNGEPDFVIRARERFGKQVTA